MHGWRWVACQPVLTGLAAYIVCDVLACAPVCRGFSRSTVFYIIVAPGIGMLMSAWNLYFLGKYGEAKELFQRVLLYNPQDTSAKEGLSMIK